jgi:hypothetical protein
MTIVLAIIAVVCLGLLVVAMFNNKKLEGHVAAANQETERLRQQYETETQRVYGEAQAAVADAQKQIDQQFTELKQESERLRQHYETETRKSQEAAAALVTKTIQEFEPLRKFEKFRDAETEAQRQLDDALKDAASLRAEAQTLMELAKTAAADERAQAVQRAKALRDQADALLNQATRDAGHVMAEAEKRAEKIGGDAYRALREKETLEQAAEAMRNIVEGYGDRYLVPTHSLLDDLAADFGFAAAGESLKSARDLSRRMVLQGEAATCDYVEADRRKTAIQFVIFAFNGLVDSILSRIRKDDPGTLKQEILDAHSKVNLNGQAFRNARVLPAYLDARLAELNWAAVVQEMAQRRQEAERDARLKARDEEMARRENERKIQEAKKEEELKRTAREEVLHEHEKEMMALSARLETSNEQQQVELLKQMDEQKAKFEMQLKQKDEEIRAAEEKSARAISNAQKMKHGHIYIISNIGSFDSDVFKIGMTRRDEWDERIKELYSASVPFGFDVHGIIESDDAPALEYKLHQAFLRKRVNKMNLHKEHFHVSFMEIQQEVEKLKQGEDYTAIKVELTEKAAATEWYASKKIDADKQELEKWYNRRKLAKPGRSTEIDDRSSFDEP